MPRAEFTAEVERQGASTVIHLFGDIDRNAHDRLDKAARDAGEGALILDFTQAGYINSTGIALIVGLLAKARAAGHPVHAYGLSDHYQEIFEITRISDFIAIHQDERTALQAV